MSYLDDMGCNSNCDGFDSNLLSIDASESTYDGYNAPSHYNEQNSSQNKREKKIESKRNSKL